MRLQRLALHWKIVRRVATTTQSPPHVAAANGCQWTLPAIKGTTPWQWQWQLLKCSSAVVALAILNGNYVVRFGSKTFCVVATLTKESAGNPAEDPGPATGQQLLTVARNVCWLC